MKMETFARCTAGGAALLAAISLMLAQSANADNLAGKCGFDFKSLTFLGSDLQQAKCLLRAKPRAQKHFGPAPKTLPAPFETLIGTPFSLDKVKFEAYVHGLGIEPNALGGSLGEPLSHSVAGTKPQARYFVIHDVSYNLCDDTKSVARSDDPEARWNQTSKWANHKQAHLYITRDGKLIAPGGRTFATPWYATQLEKLNPDLARGLFLHIENVQLRNVLAEKGEQVWIKDGKETKCLNDKIVQTPGFTQVQYERLALVYIAASHRAGKWLVPAFHMALDDGVGTHDDPQRFDLSDLGSKICGHLTALGRKECAL